MRMPKMSCWLLLASVFSPAVMLGGEASTQRTTTPVEVARWIDEQLDATYAQARLTPAPAADDATFLRRAHLDLVGTIPSVAQARDFIADTAADKRQMLINKLIADRRLPEHMARVWRRIMIPPNSPNSNFAGNFESWLREQMAKNAAFDAMAKDIIKSNPVAGNNTPGVFYFAVGQEPAPSAGAVTRVFLGARIACAECHNHPFADWTQADFWGMAAFFSNDARNQRGSAARKLGVLSIRRPGTDKVYEGKFLGAETALIPEGKPPRDAMAEWIVRQPDFATTSVNRVWQHLFGRGLVHPVDDLDLVDNRPALLEELARKFAGAAFDLRWLMSVLCHTKLYARASDLRPKDAAEQFTHMALKALTSEQVFDALEQALGLPIAAEPASPRYSDKRRQLLDKLAESGGDAPEDYRAGILQALTMMNSDLIAAGTDVNQSRTLRAVIESPFLSPSARIETLYLAALSRPPRREELQAALAYVNRGAAEIEKRQAYADVFWSLLNSPEFVLNR